MRHFVRRSLSWDLSEVFLGIALGDGFWGPRLQRGKALLNTSRRGHITISMTITVGVPLDHLATVVSPP